MSTSLELREIRKSYTQGENELGILSALSLNVAKGEIVAIVGESGSGKSTLLSLLAGFQAPDAGDVLWQTQSTASWGDENWARFRREHLGFVFQNYHLIPYLTALENAALPLRLLGRTDPPGAARVLLERLGLGARATHLPRQLSGGEAQRVAIARALIHSPELLLADEPTGSLDARTGQNVLDTLFGLLSERRQTALIVTHSPDVAQRCHRILTLRQGRLWPS